MLIEKTVSISRGLVATFITGQFTQENRIVCGVQIVFCKDRNHWIVAARMKSCHNAINVYDSLYKSIDKDTKQAILNMFKKVGQVKINLVNMQTQRGGADCGLFAIAVAASLGYGDDPAKSTFQQ